MANKEKIDYLLIDIRELEKLVAGMRDAEIYPASFFNQTFQLTHKVIEGASYAGGVSVRGFA